MMSELDKRIIGRWVDIREVSKHLFSIIEFFKLFKQDLSSIADKLRFSSEQGIVEYKRSGIFRLLRILEDVKYKSIGLDVLTSYKTDINHLLFVTLIQRLIGLGAVPLSRQSKSEDSISVDDIEISLILKDVLRRIKANPDFKKNPAIKNILVQFAVFKREKETLTKLNANIKNKSGSSFYKNFKETFDRIFVSIRKNYAMVLKEEASLVTRKNILTLVPIEKIAVICTQQAKLFNKIFATLDFAQNEKFKVREILMMLLRAKTVYLESIEDEMKLYREWGSALGGDNPDKTGIDISQGFKSELIAVLEKLIDKESIQNEEKE
jgi:hypothetical protein